MLAFNARLEGVDNKKMRQAINLPSNEIGNYFVCVVSWHCSGIEQSDKPLRNSVLVVKRARVLLQWVQVVGFRYVLNLLIYLFIMVHLYCLQGSWKTRCVVNGIVWQRSSREGYVVADLFDGCLVFYIPVPVFFGVLLARIGMLMVRPMGHPRFLWLCQWNFLLCFSLVVWRCVPEFLRSRPSNNEIYHDTLHWSMFWCTSVYEPWEYSHFRDLGCTKRYQQFLYGPWFLHLFTLTGSLARCEPWQFSAPRFWLAWGWFYVLTPVGLCLLCQFLVTSIMARTASRRGKTTKGSHGLGKQAKTNNSLSTSTRKTRGRKSASRIIDEEAIAYHTDSTPIRRLIAQWEEDLNKQAKFQDIGMEEWKTLVPDPGHSRGHTSQCKQTVHLYWLMKSFLGKSLEHIPSSLATNTYTFLNYSQEFQQIKFQLQKQNGRLSRIEHHIPYIPQYELPGSSSKDPTPIDSVDDE